ncbi:MAG: hypothetical protein CK424_05775 [Legionella sp.]|nr:MAG: hypothetical protein CK424_05775 [Legionella sp.]
MTKFFPYKTNTHIAFDIAKGALSSAKNVLIGAPMSAYLGSSVLATSSLATVVGACALGGALLIVPLMILQKKSQYSPPQYSLREQQDFNSRVTRALHVAFVFGSACLGAAVCGLAILTVAKAALMGSLTMFILSSLMTKLNSIERDLQINSLSRYGFLNVTDEQLNDDRRASQIAFGY